MGSYITQGIEGSHSHTGAAITSTKTFEVFHKDILRVPLHHNEGGMSGLTGFLFPRITARHRLYRLQVRNATIRPRMVFSIVIIGIPGSSLDLIQTPRLR